MGRAFHPSIGSLDISTMKSFLFIAAYLAICAGTATAEREDYVLPDDENLIQEESINYENFQNKIIDNILQANDTNEYWLFTRQNPTIPQIIVNGDLISLLRSNYNGSKPLKVIAHGWTFDGLAPLNTMITAAYLDTDDVNVLVLDWGESAKGNYVNASLRVPGVGRYLGNFLQWLITYGGGSWDNVHLIGFSLGAHVVGNAGRQVGGQVRRITGLDPAGPFWGNSFALNKQSGQYVEAIHTNILFRGVIEPVGHTDFYPNGGLHQPSCDTNACAHDRAYELFASSIRTDHFVGKKCLDLIQALRNQCNGETLNMGNADLSKTGNGIYGLSTGNSWPY